MFAKSYGAVTFGVDGRIIDVEVDVSYGFPAFDIVGLLDTAVKESRERVRTAIKNTGVKLKPARVTINLAPADIRKDSSRKNTNFQGFYGIDSIRVYIQELG